VIVKASNCLNDTKPRLGRRAANRLMDCFSRSGTSRNKNSVRAGLRAEPHRAAERKIALGHDLPRLFTGILNRHPAPPSNSRKPSL
jgi:hypothetical protein